MTAETKKLNKHNRIVVEPYGGLCNRMRCISSAYQYSKEQSCELYIIWNELDELNCDFESLFNINGDVRTRVIDIPYKGIRKLIRKIRKKILLMQCINMVSDIGPEDEVGDLKGSFIRSCGRWYGNNSYDMFSLNNELQKRVGSFLSENGRGLIGIHIRRTDNVVSIEKSPTRLFYSKIKERLKEKPESNIYIASDDDNEIIKMKGHFPKGKVVSLDEIVRRRDVKQGILDATVELYILANCKEIIGSSYSSYTETAADIYGINKYIISNES